MSLSRLLGTTAVLGLLGASAEAATIYAQTFDSDPGWTTDQPDNFAWDADTGTYVASTYSEPTGAAPSRYAYTMLNLDTSQSFRLQWDQQIQSQSGTFVASHFGLTTADLAFETNTLVGTPQITPNSTLNLGVGRSSGLGYLEFNLQLPNGYDGDSGGISSNEPGTTPNKWFTYSLGYDAATSEVTRTIVDRASGDQIGLSTHTISGGFDPSMINLGVGNHGFGYVGPRTPQTPSDNQRIALDNIFVTGEFLNPPPPPLIPDVVPQTVSNVIKRYNDPSFPVWTQQFDWSYSNKTLSFSVNIQLAGDDVAGAYDVITFGENAGRRYVDVWKAGIEGIWEGGAFIINGDNPAEIIGFDFDVEFVDLDADHTINVARQFPFKPNALNWALDLSYVNPTYSDDYHDEFAAHEFAHLLGLYDEYVGGANDPLLNSLERSSLCRGSTGVWCNSIMGSLGGDVQARHYNKLLEFTGFAEDKFLLLAMVPPGYYNGNSPLPLFEEVSMAAVPVPGSFPLSAAGILVLLLVGTPRFRTRCYVTART